MGDDNLLYGYRGRMTRARKYTKVFNFTILIALGVYDLLALYMGWSTISEEITDFSYTSISPPLLVGLLSGHFFLNRFVKKFSKNKYSESESKVGYPKAKTINVLIISAVFCITAWDMVAYAILGLPTVSTHLVNSEYYSAAVPFFIGLITGSIVWPAEVKR